MERDMGEGEGEGERQNMEVGAGREVDGRWEGGGRGRWEGGGLMDTSQWPQSVDGVKREGMLRGAQKNEGCVQDISSHGIVLSMEAGDCQHPCTPPPRRPVLPSMHRR